MHKISQKNAHTANAQKGFTLIEILIVIAMIAILASIVIIAVNPARQFAQARNTQRRSDVNTVLNAVYQYAVDNNGSIPTGIPVSLTCPGSVTSEICQTGGAFCAGLLDLSTPLVGSDQRYLIAMPIDPSTASSGTSTTNYHATQSINGRITVCAPDQELGQVISVTR